MGPVENHAISGSVESLDCITRRLGEVELGQSIKRLAQLLGQIIAGWKMVWVSKDGNVGMECL